jgi:hypothetical protein
MAEDPQPIVGIIPTIVTAGVATHMVKEFDKDGKRKKHSKKHGKSSGKKHHKQKRKMHMLS